MNHSGPELVEIQWVSRLSTEAGIVRVDGYQQCVWDEVILAALISTDSVHFTLQVTSSRQGVGFGKCSPFVVPQTIAKSSCLRWLTFRLGCEGVLT